MCKNPREVVSVWTPHLWVEDRIWEPGAMLLSRTSLREDSLEAERQRGEVPCSGTCQAAPGRHCVHLHWPVVKDCSSTHLIVAHKHRVKDISEIAVHGLNPVDITQSLTGKKRWWLD